MISRMIRPSAEQRATESTVGWWNRIRTMTARERGGVGLAVAAPIEAVPASGHPRGGRDRTRAAALRKGGFRANAGGVIAAKDQQLGGGVGADPEALIQGGRRLGRASREVSIMRGDFLGEGEPATSDRPERMLGGRGGRVEGARSECCAGHCQVDENHVVRPQDTGP